MRENIKTCPVCFTKMKPHKDGLICPECGYKLCDHRQNADIFNTNHTHTPEYTTYKTPQNTPQSGSVRNSAARTTRYSSDQSSAAKPAQTVRSGADGTPGGKAISKIVRTVVILYILYLFMSVIGQLFF